MYKTLVLTELCYQYHAMAPPMNLAMDQNSNIAVLLCVHTTKWDEIFSDGAFLFSGFCNFTRYVLVFFDKSQHGLINNYKYLVKLQMYKRKNVHSERNTFLLYFEYVSIKLGVKTKSQLTIKIQLSTFLQPSFISRFFKNNKNIFSFLLY